MIKRIIRRTITVRRRVVTIKPATCRVRVTVTPKPKRR